MKNFVKFKIGEGSINEKFIDDPEYVKRFEVLNKHIQSVKWPSNMDDYTLGSEYANDKVTTGMVRASNAYNNVLQFKMKYLTTLFEMLEAGAAKNDYTNYDTLFDEYRLFERRRKLSITLGTLMVLCFFGALFAVGMLIFG